MLVLSGHVGRSVGFAWCGSVGAVSGHRFSPIYLAVALDAAHFSENALLQPDNWSSCCSGHCGGACQGGLSGGCNRTFVGLPLGYFPGATVVV